MNVIAAYAALLSLDEAVITTADASARLAMNRDHASHTLARLANVGHVSRLKRGLWLIDTKADPLAIAHHVTAPFPSYLSLQTALYYHGMISQIPAVIFLASLARTRWLTSPSMTCSIHHIAPPFFFGFEEYGPDKVRIATPEKALLDFCYLSSTRSNLFKTLPEVELPRRFSTRKARNMIKKIRAKGKRSHVTMLYEKIVEKSVA